MFRTLALTSLCALALATTACNMNPTASEQEVGSAQPMAAVNTVCPIAGKPIDGKTFVTYHGHKVGFCCGGCDDTFVAWSDQKKTQYLASFGGQPTTQPK